MTDLTEVKVRNKYEKTLVAISDSGYNRLCPWCCKRWIVGEPTFGVRELKLITCGRHEKDAKALDLDRIKEHTQAVDPPKALETYLRPKVLVDKRYRKNKATQRPLRGSVEKHRIVGFDADAARSSPPPSVNTTMASAEILPAHPEHPQSP